MCKTGYKITSSPVDLVSLMLSVTLQVTYESWITNISKHFTQQEQITIGSLTKPSGRRGVGWMRACTSDLLNYAVTLSCLRPFQYILLTSGSSRSGGQEGVRHRGVEWRRTHYFFFFITFPPPTSISCKMPYWPLSVYYSPHLSGNISVPSLVQSCKYYIITFVHTGVRYTTSVSTHHQHSTRTPLCNTSQHHVPATDLEWQTNVPHGFCLWIFL